MSSTGRPTMKLYSYHRNSAGERVRIAMNLKGIAYEYVSAPAMGDAAYRAINPQGLLPALEIDGRIIAQSAAILAWLEETHQDPPLLSADPILRAEARAFAQLITSEMHSLTVVRVRKVLAETVGGTEQQIAAWCQHWMHEGLAALEAALQRRNESWSYCFGEQPGWADVHLVPQLRNARRFGCDLTTYPMLTGIEARCVDLEAFRRARPEFQPDFPGAAQARA
jgi:maleylacetoacetate isomerase